jgi:gingipain R
MAMFDQTVLHYSVNIQLPENGNPSISVNYGSTYEEYSNILVAPSKGILKRNVDPSTIPYSFSAVYSQNSNYPATGGVSFDPFLFLFFLSNRKSAKAALSICVRVCVFV